MGSETEAEAEAEAEQGTIPRLPLFSVPPVQSPERSGMLTPPLHNSASVPFRWEQEPGKPRPCTALVSFSNSTKCLELPPRLLLDAKLSQLPSPTTVLEGPYVRSNSFRSPSLRMATDCYGSFSAERGSLGAMVLSKGGGFGVNKDKGWFGSLRKKKKAFFKGRREVSGSSHVFPSSADNRETESFPSLSSHGKSRVWTTVCEGLKLVVPWRSRKPKRDGCVLRL